MRDELMKIINHYGIDKTLRKLHEEHFELDDAIIRYNNCGGTKQHILEEFVDVFVIMSELVVYYDLNDEDVTKMAIYKINRQLGRMEQESKESEK